MNVEGASDIALFTIIHRWPAILSSVFPSGTGEFFERDLTCTPMKCVASGDTR